MSHFPHGAFHAAHQAQERRRREEEEEEEMTPYTTKDLDQNWEFKILRSESGAFRRPEIFQSVLQEESMAGWEMVEKLDNRRIRFKRRRDAQRRDAGLPPGYDPYRTYYGNPTARRVVIITIAVMIALMTGVMVMGIGSLENTRTGSAPVLIWPMIVIIGIVGLMVGAIALMRRR